MSVSVCFVCTGNICRSPMAEAVFSQLVHEAGLSDQIRVDSAGTSRYHEGEPAHRGTLAILEKHGIQYNGRSRPLVKEDLRRFDYLIAMDDEHLDTIRYLGTSPGTVARLLDFAPHQPIREVPDPYYDNRFAPVYDLVLEGSRGLLEHIRKAHQL